MKYCLLLYLLVPLVLSTRPPEDICHHHGGRRLYVDLGESGSLIAANVTSPAVGWTGRGPGPSTRSNQTSHQQCSVELVTCPSCVFKVVFRQMNLISQCGGGNYAVDSSCRCDYVWITEPPYDDSVGQQFCGIQQESSPDSYSLKYISKTRTLSVSLLHNESHKQAFSLEFIAISNRQVISGGPAGYANSTGSLTTPFFPLMYPRDLGAEYLLTCTEPDCRIRVTFTDFQIATVSFVEFIERASHRLEIFSGSSFRPPTFISSGPSLLIRFYASGASGSGFKAVYSFITGMYAETAVKPITDCGGSVEDFGGAITMMNMIPDGIRTYDCIWLIRPTENFLHLKTHLFLKVATFLDFAGNSELQIRQGLTSEGNLLETLRHPISQLHFQRPKEHVEPVTLGYYVRLQGSFNAASRLAITYAAFSYNKCFPGSEFLCANHRCIAGKLSCDSFDHCGDNSDEPVSCNNEWTPEMGDRQWYSQTPNYYFPKADRFADLKTATVVFLISSLALIVLISALIVLLYRMNSRARQQRELQSHLQAISDLLDNPRIEEIIPDEPPLYEPPPDYEEVLKSTPSSTARRKRRVAHHGSRRSRSSPPERRRPSLGTTLPILEVSLPPERRRRPRHLRPPSAGLARQPSDASATSVGCQSRQNSPLPDSPPPPYSPTNCQAFVFSTAPIPVLQVTEPEIPPRAQSALLDIPTSWCVTAVSTSSPSDAPPSPSNEGDPRRRLRGRSMSCIDYRNYEQLILRRQTQSNPLTPTVSPPPEWGSSAVTPAASPTTDSDFYVFSSLDSTDLTSSYIRSKDFFDWEEFDKQFPGRKSTLMKGKKVTEILKKYDELVFVNNGEGCECEGACSCAMLGKKPAFEGPVSQCITNVWDNNLYSYVLDMSQD